MSQSDASPAKRKAGAPPAAGDASPLRGVRSPKRAASPSAAARSPKVLRSSGVPSPPPVAPASASSSDAEQLNAPAGSSMLLTPSLTEFRTNEKLLCFVMRPDGFGEDRIEWDIIQLL